MECVACGRTAISERHERTAQGYRRFRFRDCGKQFNEQTGGSLNRTQYPSDVIASGTSSEFGAAESITCDSSRSSPAL
jgi:hypothetical protein